VWLRREKQWIHTEIWWGKFLDKRPFKKLREIGERTALRGSEGDRL
jgi:hypothetical protein